jgi:hypothetical protein
MGKINITKGEWLVGHNYPHEKNPLFWHTKVFTPTIGIAESFGVGKETAEANAKLIALAGNLAQKYNLEALPDLEATLERVRNIVLNTKAVLNNEGKLSRFEIEELNYAIENIDKALKKARYE